MRAFGYFVVGMVVAAAVGCGSGEDEFTQHAVDLAGKPPEVAYTALQCAKCHGPDLAGQRTAPKLVGLAKRWSNETLIEYLRDPKAVQAATPRLAYMAERYPIEMPAYPHTDEDVLRNLAGWILAQ